MSSSEQPPNVANSRQDRGVAEEKIPPSSTGQHTASSSHNATVDRSDERLLDSEDWEIVAKEEAAPERRASDPGTTTSAHFELGIGFGKWKHTVYSANYQWKTVYPRRDGDSKDKEEESSGKTE